jgi:hypothetical protein
LFDLIAELREVERKLNPRLPTRDEKSWSQFIEWFSKKELELSSSSGEQTDKPPAHDNGGGGGQQAGGTPSRLFDRVGIKPQLESSAISDHNTNEYSLVAKVPFKKGDKIFEIDRRLMLTTETALKDLELCDFVKRDSIASGMQNVVLVLHLLNEFSKQEQSQWWPYLSILPNKILPILHMNKEQITNYLMASAHLHTALKMLRAIIRQYSYFYKRLQSTKLPLRHDFTFLYYTWGVSMVCSRQNEIPSSPRHHHQNHHHHQIDNSQNHTHDNNEHHDHQQQQHSENKLCSSSVHALIPVLDMCNHNRHSNQALFENDASCLVAAEDLLPNQEITINYGCRSSGDFYIHNGFVPDEVSFDMIGLVIALNQKQDPLYEQKAKILKILNMPTTFGEFTLRSNDYENRHRRDPHLTMFLIVYFLNEEEIDYLLASDNPVGVADEIYDYVQYESCDPDKQQQQPQSPPPDGASDAGPVDKMKRRILGCIRSYLSRRASISIVLLDRTLKALESELPRDGADDAIRVSTMKLLRRERKIYESHVLN